MPATDFPLVSLVAGDPLKLGGDVLVIPLFDADLSIPVDASPAFVEADRALESALSRTAKSDGFKGKTDQTFVLHALGKLKADRVLLVGLGARERYTPEVLRLAAGKAVKAAMAVHARDIALVLPAVEDLDEAMEAAAEGVLLGAYRFDRYRTQDRDERTAVSKVRLVLPHGASRSRTLDAALERASRVAHAANFARDLTNEPAQNLTPQRLAEHAQTVGKARGLRTVVSGPKELAKLRMGMFLAVGQGSQNEPRLIEVTYTPKNSRFARRAPVALVGKAITFDSGGLSLKPADGMIDMKTDMAGSAAVLGTMQVVAELEPPFPVHAFLGAAENMPSGSAYRPGDILVSRLGKTVEVTNTDAEGRLVLGDVLAYAAERRPSALIDVATLTGACIVALGQFVVGAFSPDEALIAEVLEAAERAGESMWRLPIVEQQKEALRSEVADMKNSADRWGAAINAAIFLREFVGDAPWVHLDIAGPSQSPKERGYFSKGATGVGVRTLVELIRARAELADPG